MAQLLNVNLLLLKLISGTIFKDMSKTQLVKHSPKALSYYLQQMQISADFLAQKTGISLTTIQKGLVENEVFTLNQLNKIADKLLVSATELALNHLKTKNIPTIIDHRNQVEVLDEVDNYALNRVIHQAYLDRENLLDIYESMEIEPSEFNLKLKGNDIEGDAQAIREFLQVDEARLLVEGSDYYRSWRLLLEKQDIIVLEKERVNIGSEGMAMYYPVLPIIIVMSAGQSNSRKLFTLIHELVHLGLQQSSVDGNLLQSSQDIEKYCNQVAGYVLVPINIINSTFNNLNSLSENITNIRKLTKVSFQAIAIQLMLVGKIDYKELNEYLDSLSHKLSEEGFFNNKKKYTTYNHFGKVYLQQIFSAVWENVISINNAMQILRIKNMDDFQYLENKAFN